MPANPVIADFADFQHTEMSANTDIADFADFADLFWPVAGQMPARQPGMPA